MKENECTQWYLMVGNASLGCVVYTNWPNEEGWRFIPHTSAHQPGRKLRRDMFDAIPKWAFNQSTDLITRDEWVDIKTGRAIMDEDGIFIKAEAVNDT